jgi:RNA polymerase sigma-70 factor (ECF subfamily)
MGGQDDDDLVARIGRGDREAFALLYGRYRPDVYRFAAHMCGSAAAADDVAQDVFVTVIQHAGRYRANESGARPWLLGIARNLARRRRGTDRTLPLPEDESGVRALIVEPDPVGDLARRRNLAALRQALLSLPFRYREAIVLCDVQELTYAEAAAAIGCALGTVRSRLHRGRAMLGGRLAGQESGLVYSVPATRSIP